METKPALLLMRLGMILVTLGAIIFFLTGDFHQPMVNHLLVWGCCSATAIFFAGTSAINGLKKRISELEEEGGQEFPVEHLTDDLQKIHSLLK
ncbi:MAG: hypothetical protein KKE57_02175 [Proteobacteria bacterium]|nr:hypothetical protein [Pseudomonadota bacterium]